MVRSTASRVVVLAAAVSSLIAWPFLAAPAAGAPGPRLPEALPRPAAAGDTYEVPGRTTRVSVDAGGQLSTPSSGASISEDGRYVVFRTTLMIGSIDVGRILLRDRVANATTEVVRGAQIGGTLAAVVGYTVVAAPAISGDGRLVAYTSGGTSGVNLTIYIWDRQTQAAAPAMDARIFGDQPRLSHDGSVLAFRTNLSLSSADTNVGSDIYVYDRLKTAFDLVSVPDPAWKFCGTTLNNSPAISGDGSRLAFVSNCSRDGLGSYEIELRDRTAKSTVLVSHDTNSGPGKGNSAAPSISGDGRTVAFESLAENLVPGDNNARSDAFVWGADGGTISRISVSTEGAQANGSSGEVSISTNGRIVAFSSDSSTLVPNDASGPVAGSVSPRDVFVRDLARSRTTRISFGVGPTEPAGSSTNPAVDGFGDAVAFQSTAANLVTGDTNRNTDVFVRERWPQIALSANPTDFGTVTPASAAASKTVTLTNSGAGPARIQTISFGGPAAAAFKVASEDCTSRAVYPAESCSINVTFTPGAPGEVAASVVAADQVPDIQAFARLAALVSNTTIELSPKVGPPGLVVKVSGHGFAPNQPVALAWHPGLTATPLTPIVAGADGTFRVQVLVLRNDVLGPRKLVATATIAGHAVQADGDFLVVQGSAGPPRNTGVPLPAGWTAPFVERH